MPQFMGTMPLSCVSLRKTPLRYSTAANPEMRGTVKWKKSDTTIKYRPFHIAFQYFYYLCINIIQQPALNATDSEAFKTVPFVAVPQQPPVTNITPLDKGLIQK